MYFIDQNYSEHANNNHDVITYNKYLYITFNYGALLWGLSEFSAIYMYLD